MNQSARHKGVFEDVTLKRPGIHDHRPYDMYHQEESQDGPRNVQTSRGNFGSSISPLRKKEENGIFFIFLSKNLIVVFTVLIVILGVGVEVLFPPVVDEERGYRQFNANLRNLQKTFLNQTEQLWHVPLSAAKPVLLQKFPKHPAVIFLTGSKSSQAVTDCLARKLSELVNYGFDVRNPVFILDCRTYEDWKADTVKQEINEKLTSTFENGTKVALILALESLPGDSPMIFKQFCDEFDAPFKKVVLVMTLNKELRSTSEKDKEAHKDTTGLLEPVMAKDKFDILSSHFTKSVAYVRDEENQLDCVAGKG